jgi:hypothetical protein
LFNLLSLISLIFGGFLGDESCGSLNDDGRDSVVSGDGHTSSGKRKVPKVFSKEAITKFRAWLFQNLTVLFLFSAFECP